MSRGHGWVQRALLIELGEEAERRPGEGLDTATLARRLFPNGRRWSWDKPANAHTATVSRALAGLKRDGLATVTYSHETMGGVFKYDSQWTITEAGRARTPR